LSALRLPPQVNGAPTCSLGYLEYHRRRIDLTLALLRRVGARRILELGAHPWLMTASLIACGEFELCATVSAEEVTRWPDDLGVQHGLVHLELPDGRRATVRNYCANLERRLFSVEEVPDTIVGCEIIEHLIRAPHVMLLNANRWLPAGGRLLLTTPNGAQFSNPLRRRSPTAAYRANVYERHSYLYTRADLVDLVELCGFRVREVEWWDPYARRGPAALYGALARIPLDYFREKFAKTIVVLAEKEADVRALPRAPRVYDPRGGWEYIAEPAVAGP
jgi:hypothetical protein